MSLTRTHCEDLAAIYNRTRDRLQYIAPNTTRPICEELYTDLFNFLRHYCVNFNHEKFYKATHKHLF